MFASSIACVREHKETHLLLVSLLSDIALSCCGQDQLLLICVAGAQHHRRDDPVAVCVRCICLKVDMTAL